MGLGKSTTDAIFVKVVKGLGLVVRVKPETEGAEPRKLKTGETVYELIYDHLSGYVKDIDIRTTEYNGTEIKFWSIRMTDQGETYLLSLPFSSRYSSSFLKRLPNVDFTKRLTVHVAHFEQDDTTALWLSQEGEKVEQAYNKENPNGLPEMEQVKVKGQMVWDDSKMMDFLTDMVEKDIKPKLSELNKIEPAEAPAGGEDEIVEAEIIAEEEEDLGLPF